jgi:hypothetical protein
VRTVLLNNINPCMGSASLPPRVEIHRDCFSEACTAPMYRHHHTQARSPSRRLCSS